MKIKILNLVLALVFAITINYRFFDNVSGLVSVTFVDIVSVGVAIAFIGALSYSEILRKRVLTVLIENKFIILFFIWISAVSVVNLLTTDEPAKRAKDLIPGFLLLVTATVCVRRQDQLIKIAVTYLLGSAIQAILGASQIIFGAPRPTPISEGAEYKTNIIGEVAYLENLPTGLATHPNGLALLLVGPILFAFGIILTRQASLKLKSLATLSIITMTYVLWHTQAKGAIIWLLVGLIIMLIPVRYFRIYRHLGFFVLLLGVFLIFNVSLFLYDQYGEMGTVVGRLQLSEAALAVIWENPSVLLFGGGADLMYTYSRWYSNMTYPSSHNLYLDLVLIFGLPSVIFYIGISAMALQRAAKLAEIQSNPLIRNLMKSIYVGILASLGLAAFEPALSGQFQLPFIILVALALAVSSDSLRIRT